jgi:hypothetical protein
MRSRELSGFCIENNGMQRRMFVGPTKEDKQSAFTDTTSDDQLILVSGDRKGL